MTLSKRDRYLRNHEQIKGRAIYKIFTKQKALLVDMLDRWSKSIIRWATKSWEDDTNGGLDEAIVLAQLAVILDDFMEQTRHDIPNYLLSVLPRIMREWAKGEVEKIREMGKTDFEFAFDIETWPAAEYFQKLETLMLSDYKGSINKTTKDEIKKILEDGVRDGYNPWEIAKKIRELDPFVFSRTRAMLISTNECGRAFGYGNYMPYKRMHDDGYKIQKRWITKNDSRVRPSHMVNQDDGWIPFGSTFSGTDDAYAPSSTSIRCRCISTYDVLEEN